MATAAQPSGVVSAADVRPSLEDARRTFAELKQLVVPLLEAVTPIVALMGDLERRLEQLKHQQDDLTDKAGLERLQAKDAELQKLKEEKEQHTHEISVLRRQNSEAFDKILELERRLIEGAADEDVGGGQEKVPQQRPEDRIAISGTPGTGVNLAKKEEFSARFSVMLGRRSLSESPKPAAKRLGPGLSRSKSSAPKAMAGYTGPSVSSDFYKPSVLHSGGPSDTPEEHLWLWTALSKPGEGYSSLRCESLLVHAKPSTSSRVAGCVFLEKPFWAKPAAGSKAWLEVQFCGKTGFLHRCNGEKVEGPYGQLYNVLIQREPHPAQVVQQSSVYATQEFALTATATEALQTLIKADQDPSRELEDFPTQVYFWQVRTRNAETYPDRWSKEANGKLNNTNVVLGKKLDKKLETKSWIELTDMYGQTAFVEQRHLRLVSDPRDILSPGAERLIEVTGPGSSFWNPRPLEIAVGRREAETQLRTTGPSQLTAESLAVVRAAALHAIEAYEGKPPEGSMTIKDVSDLSSKHRTFKVELPLSAVVDLPRDAFVLRCDRPRLKDLAVKGKVPAQVNQVRIEGACVALEKAGLGPQFCGSTPGCVLEKFVSTLPVLQANPEDSPNEMGLLLARVHKETESDWCKEILALYKEFLPWAHDLGFGHLGELEGAHVWWRCGWPNAFQGLDEEQLRKWAHNTAYHPQTTPGQRIVLNHGDFIPSNIVRTEDGEWKVIDTEFSVRTCAVQDLSYTLAYLKQNHNYSQREEWEFVMAYLQGMGDLQQMPSNALQDDLMARFLDDIRVFGQAERAFQNLRDPPRHPHPHPQRQVALQGQLAGISNAPVVFATPKERPMPMPTPGPPGGIVGRVRLRLPEVGTVKTSGDLGFWKPQLLPGWQLGRDEAEALKLFDHRVSQDTPQTFVPLDKAVLARQRLGVSGGKQLRVTLDACAELISSGSQGGIIWKKLDGLEVERLLSKPEDVFDLCLSPQATAALSLLASGKKVPKSKQDSARWYKVKDFQNAPPQGQKSPTTLMFPKGGVRVRTKKDQDRGSILTNLPAGSFVLARPSDSPDPNVNWVELVPIFHHRNAPVYMQKSRVEQGVREELLNLVVDVAEVLGAWNMVWDRADMPEIPQLDDSDFTRIAVEAAGVSAAVSCVFKPRRDKTRRTCQVMVEAGIGQAHLCTLRVESAARRPLPGIPRIIQKERVAAGRQVLAAGPDLIGPRQISEGPDYQLEDWLGSQTPTTAGPAEADLEYAEVLARMHSLDVKWFEQFRELYRQHIPELRKAKPCSHVWQHLTRRDFETTQKSNQRVDILEVLGTPAEIAKWAEWSFPCRSQYSQILAFCHGDLLKDRRKRFKKTESGVRLVGGKNFCVTWILEDLCAVVEQVKTARARCEFVRTYMAEMGYPNLSQEQIQDIVFDSRCYKSLKDKRFTRNVIPGWPGPEELERVQREAMKDGREASKLRDLIIDSSLSDVARGR